MVWRLPKTGRFLLETRVVSFHLAWYAAANPPSHIPHRTTTLPWWPTEQTSRIVLWSLQITAAILRASQIPATDFGAWQPSRLQPEQPSELQGASQAASNRTGASQSAPGSYSRARSQESWQLLIVSFRKTQNTFFFYYSWTENFPIFLWVENIEMSLFVPIQYKKHTGIHVSSSIPPHHKTSESQLVLLVSMPLCLWKITLRALSDETVRASMCNYSVKYQMFKYSHNIQHANICSKVLVHNIIGMTLLHTNTHIRMLER